MNLMNLLSRTIEQIIPQDQNSRILARSRLEQLTMPYWALGRLMDLALDLAGICGCMSPPIERRVVVVMAADHGVVEEGVSKYPREVTGQMVLNFVNGGAGINALSRTARSKVVVVDMGVASDLSDLVADGSIYNGKIGMGNGNMAQGPAMSREQAVLSIETGIKIALELGDTTDLFGAGEMGIGNTTASSAITSVLTGRSPREVTGRGTGIDDPEYDNKISIIEKSIRKNQPDSRDALDVLAKIGGFEIGGIAGLILGAASLNKPVLLDGFISTAGALIAHALNPVSADYMIAAQQSVEQGHRYALARLGKLPLLDLDLRLGEGTGAALAMPMVEAAFRILTEVATFEEASVSKAES
jgi:nicotinate-nucleotide--dimethylbenzimidazole phosphoribosyltransferase